MEMMFLLPRCTPRMTGLCLCYFPSFPSKTRSNFSASALSSRTWTLHSLEVFNSSKQTVAFFFFFYTGTSCTSPFYPFPPPAAGIAGTRRPSAFNWSTRAANESFLSMVGGVPVRPAATRCCRCLLFSEQRTWSCGTRCGIFSVKALLRGLKTAPKDGVNPYADIVKILIVKAILLISISLVGSRQNLCSRRR